MTDDLAARFRRLIADVGPISVARFMGESNAYYYVGRDPLGAAGDFTTAPEISQMFGELAGLWLADVWIVPGAPAMQSMSSLAQAAGTLAKDALRAMAGAGLRPDIHLVEGSPTLRAVQAGTLPVAQFHDDASTLPDGRPLLILANEFLDALPISQLVRTDRGWRERMVGLDGEALVFVAGDQPMDLALPDAFADSPTGTIVETNPGAAAVVEEIARRLARQGGAALFIDYGHLEPRTGSTLQAVRMHRKVDALSHPGEADLTAHVDFAVLADIARGAGCTVAMATQGAWLTAMGIDLRADMLSRAAPERANEIHVAKNRLVSAAEMGKSFKVMGLTGPSWPVGVGVSTEEDAERDAETRT